MEEKMQMEELIPEKTVPAEAPAAEEQETPVAPEDAAEPELAEDAAEPERTEDAEEEVTEEEYNAFQLWLGRSRYFSGALRFYAFLLGGILCVLILLWCLMSPLQTLLTQYETARPEYVAEEIYNAFFADPDWGLLYDMAGAESTKFEGKRQYTACMEKLVGDQALEYVEISGGLTGEKRYSVRLNGQELASFTMLPVDDGVSRFSRWAFGAVEIVLIRSESVTVTTSPDYTVYINNVALDDSYTTLQVSTAAEDYLPQGVHGYRYQTQTVTGLMTQPDVVVLDEFNNPVELQRDPITGEYSTEIPNTNSITWAERELVTETIEAHVLFLIQEYSMTQLREYFSPGSQAYDVIGKTEPITDKWKTYTISQPTTIDETFYRYSDTLFSAWAQVTVELTDKKGNVTSYTIGGTYFFNATAQGTVMATGLYEPDLQELIYQYPNGAHE